MAAIAVKIALQESTLDLATICRGFLNILVLNCEHYDLTILKQYKNEVY
jgi:hypothetical protein